MDPPIQRPLLREIERWCAEEKTLPCPELRPATLLTTVPTSAATLGEIEPLLVAAKKRWHGDYGEILRINCRSNWRSWNLPDTIEAEEVADDVLLKACDKREKFVEDEPAGNRRRQFIGWLLRVLDNHVLDLRKRLAVGDRDPRRTARVDLPPDRSSLLAAALVPEGREPSPSSGLRLQELRAAIAEAKATMRPQALEAWQAYEDCDMNAAEAARQLGWEPGKTSYWIARAWEGLRVSLQEFQKVE